MEARRGHLLELLAYLDAKLRWMTNPFLRRPIPPEGETFLDPALTTSQEYAKTGRRAEDTRERLERSERWFLDHPTRR